MGSRTMRRRASIDVQTLVDSHDLPYQVIDRERRVVAVNEAFRRQFGCAADNAIGEFCYRLTHGRDRACHLDGETCPHEQVFGFGTRSSGLRERTAVGGRRHLLRQIAVPLTTAEGELLMGKALVRESDQDAVEPLARIEQRQIHRLLDLCGGNRRRVAERLGISERTLYRRLKHYRAD